MSTLLQDKQRLLEQKNHELLKLIKSLKKDVNNNQLTFIFESTDESRLYNSLMSDIEVLEFQIKHLLTNSLTHLSSYDEKYKEWKLNALHKLANDNATFRISLSVNSISIATEMFTTQVDISSNMVIDMIKYDEEIDPLSEAFIKSEHELLTHIFKKEYDSVFKVK